MEALKQYLNLCWFEKKPLELIRSVRFFKQNLVFYYFAQFFLQSNLTDDPIESFYEVSLEVVLTLIFIGLMLLLNKTLHAYFQVCSAILFCANVVSFFAIPVVIWLTMTENPLSYYFLTLLLLWYFSLVSYIIKMVAVINIFASLALSFLYFTFVYVIAIGLGQML